MRIRTGLAALPLLFLAPSTMLEAGEPSEAPPLVRFLDRPVPPDPDPGVVRERAVEVDFGVARDRAARSVQLPLFGDAGSLVLVRTEPPLNEDGSVIWSGIVDGQPRSSVVFSAANDVLIANIATQPTKTKPAEYYQIRFLERGVHVLRQIDPSVLPSERDPIRPKALRKKRARAATCKTDTGARIDVLVLYTKNARKKARSIDAMKEAIKVYVKETNQSYSRSGVSQRLKLVGTEEVDYAESNNLEDDLDSLKGGIDVLSTAHTTRESVGADLVALIVEYTELKTDQIGCGQAYIMETKSNSFESSAFAVVPRVCADDQYSFAHELGHLMGARHDWAVDRDEMPFKFSHGFVHLPDSEETEPAFRTIMAKDDACGFDPCPRVPYWSNPSETYQPSGVLMGVAGGEEPANNTETLEETASTVANFRCHK